MKELRSACLAQGPLMVGPDNAVYVIAKNDRAVNRIADPAGSPASPVMPAAQDIRVRRGHRGALEYLPRMPEVAPC
jgi:hypothetical protein